MISLVFPGQGSQKVGMGLEFYNKYELAKKIFRDTDQILGIRSQILLNGPQEKLNQTTFIASYLLNWSCDM